MYDGSNPTTPPVNDKESTPAALTIRVPVEYTPPTPPPSACLPALPPQRQSLTPISAAQRKRASAPALSWNGMKSFVPDDTSTAPATRTLRESPVPPVNVAVTEAESAPPPPTMIMVATTARLSTATAKKAQAVVQEAALPPNDVPSSAGAVHPPIGPKNPHEKHASAAPRYGPELLPPAPTAPRRRSSAPGIQEKQRKRLTTTLHTAPSHVSLIDFESSESDEDEEQEEQEEKGGKDEEGDDDETQSDTQPPSSHLGEPAPRKRLDDDEEELSRWAPDPAYARSRSSVSNSLRSGERVRAAPTAKLLGMPIPGERVQRDVDAHFTMRRDADYTVRRDVDSPMRRDVDFTLRALMSPEMFARMLANPLARQRFREYLALDGDRGTAPLDAWTDAQFLAQEMERVQADAAAFRDLYLAPSSAARGALGSETRRDLLGALQRILAVDSSLGTTQTHLLESLYQVQFQGFVKHKLIQEAHVTLGRASLAGGAPGLGDTFVLTNPRLPDHPIVLVSDGFVEVTGYARAQIIGRNCRFLQGPGTPPACVQRIRDGLNSGKGCTELLLNYRRNGDPFYCLLCIIPVRDASGAIVYFIGGQTNVTGLLAADGGLGLHEPAQTQMMQMQMSPALAALRAQAGNVLPPEAGGRAAGSTTGSTGRASGGGGGFLRGLFGRGGASAGAGAAADGKQLIAGAEARIGGPGAHPRGLQDQYALFQNTYNKVLIFRAKKREITFVSPQMLAYLGLPTRSPRELHAPPLIRSDIAALLTAGEDRAETRRLRDDLKDAVRAGAPCSLYCGVKVPGKGKGILNRSDSRLKFGMMHVTPIKDGDNVAVAFVAIFG